MTKHEDIPADIWETAKEVLHKASITIFKDDAIDEIARAILAERLRDQWQPIETAPKDGSTIILFCPQGDGTPGSTFRLTSGSWFIPPLHGTISDPEVDEQEQPSWLSWDGGFSEETMMPTLWQPLPAPPKGGVA